MNRPHIVDPDCANIRWDTLPGDADGLKQLCAYAAKRFDAGDCDLVAIDCMPGERDEIAGLMAKHYPAVRYAFGSAGQVLAAARRAADSSPNLPQT